MRRESVESRARIVEGGFAERRRVERDLHDGAQQRLLALALDLRLARSTLDRDPGAAAELLDAAAGGLTEATEELRELARGIPPPVLTDRGLAAALDALASRSPVPVTVDARALGTSDLERQVERIVPGDPSAALNGLGEAFMAGFGLVMALSAVVFGLALLVAVVRLRPEPGRRPARSLIVPHRTATLISGCRGGWRSDPRPELRSSIFGERKRDVHRYRAAVRGLDGDWPAERAVGRRADHGAGGLAADGRAGVGPDAFSALRSVRPFRPER